MTIGVPGEGERHEHLTPMGDDLGLNRTGLDRLRFISFLVLFFVLFGTEIKVIPWEIRWTL